MNTSRVRIADAAGSAGSAATVSALVPILVAVIVVIGEAGPGFIAHSADCSLGEREKERVRRLTRVHNQAKVI